MQKELIHVQKQKFTIPQKCLVVMPNYIGDCVLLTAFIRNLKYNFSSSGKLDIVAQSPIAHMLSTNPYIDTIFLKEKILDISTFLKTHLYDTVIILDFSIKWQFHTCTNHINQKITSDLKRLNTNSHLVLNKFFNQVLEGTTLEDKTPQIDVYLDFLRQLGLNIFDRKTEIPLTKTDIEKAQSHISKSKKRKVFVHTSASIPSKKWPYEYWQEVFKYLKNDEIYLIGNEHPPSELIKNNVYNLCCKTNLRQTIALLQQADIVITTDSAPAHLAAVAQSQNIFVLYGPTNYHQWKPHAPNSNIVQLYANISCNPCRIRTCQSLKCIKSLTPKMVIDSLKELEN